MQAWDQQHTEDREKMEMVRLWLGCGSLGVLRDLGWLVGWLRWFGGSKLFGEVVGFSVWPCGARFYIICASRFNIHSTGGKVKFRTKVKLESVASPASS